MKKPPPGVKINGPRAEPQGLGKFSDGIVSIAHFDSFKISL
jgi:hypothetical protein